MTGSDGKYVFRRHPKFFRVIAVVMVTVIILATVEFTFWLFLRYPKLNLVVEPMRPLVSNIYISWDRNIIQFLPECVQYDSLLSYTLKPGECIFKNREFENVVRINRMGVRDDESSLSEPEIVVLGDSYGVGWGVNQEETFAQVLEKLSGKKTLNASMSSYGTAREMLMLERVELCNMKFLVIQYCGNDNIENKRYLKHGFRLENTSRDGMERMFHDHKHRGRYVPLIYILKALQHYFPPAQNTEDTEKNDSLNIATAQISVKDASASESSEELGKKNAEIFLEILSHHQGMLLNVHLVVFSINGKYPGSSDFERHVRLALQKRNYPGFMEKMAFINPEEVLTESDFYILDDHMNANGHRKVAIELNNAIRAIESGN